MNENGLKKSQSYNLAETIMPASAVIMKNSRSTFGILLNPKEKIDSNKNGSYNNVAFDKTNIWNKNKNNEGDTIIIFSLFVLKVKV